MGAAASINIGNKTETNVTNSTVNESKFSVSNCTNIVNTLNEETTMIVNAEVGITQEMWNEANITIEGTEFILDGSGHRLEITSKSSGKQKAEITANLAGYAAHSTDLTDSIMYDLATNGESMQFADMTSAAKALQTTECSSSGLFSLAVDVGIGNSVVSNINNSIKNLFSMAISNYLSSETRRNMLLKNITTAQSAVKQMNKNSSNVIIKNDVFKLIGEDNVAKITAETSSSEEAGIMSNVDSCATALQSAISNMAMSSINEATNNQTSISKAEAVSDGSSKTGSNSGFDGKTLIIIAAITGALGLVAIALKMWATVSVCSNRRASVEYESNPPP